MNAPWRVSGLLRSGDAFGRDEEARKVGHTFSQPGLIVAATALEHGLTVVTRDTGDYERARVPLLNPWVAESRTAGRFKAKCFRASSACGPCSTIASSVGAGLAGVGFARRRKI